MTLLAHSQSVLVRDLRKGVEKVATCVYGPCSSSGRIAFWGELNFVVGKWNRPWVVGGDCNVIRFSNKKKGGCSISPAMQDFSYWIHSQELTDLPLGGAKYILGLVCRMLR